MGVFSPAARQFPGGTTTAGGAVAATASTLLFADSIRSSLPAIPSRCRLIQFSRPAHSSRSLSSSSSSASRFPNPQSLPSSPPDNRRREQSSRPNLPPPSPQWIENWGGNGLRSFRRRPLAAVDYRQGLSSDDDEVGTSRSTGSSTMERIVEKLKRFGYIDDPPEVPGGPNPRPEKGTVEEIFYAEDGILPDTRGGMSWDLMKDREVMFPWEKKGEEERREEDLQARRKQSKTSLAELTLPETELRRLRHMAIRTKSKIKVGGSGVTSEIVDRIHEKWKTEEVVRLKCEGPPALNMKRMHEILERKTGGLVIWRSGSSLSLYRGLGYELSKTGKRPIKHVHTDNNHHDGSTENAMENDDRRYGKPPSEGQVSSNDMKRADEKPKEIKYEHEVDKLLEDLGPRYEDWAGPDPLPIDADLLPGIVPNYKPPFRLLPYGVRPSLGMKEGTALRRLARVLPPHFALGRSRLHQGLAAAIVRLWEKSSIVKIALKRGVQLTSSERMAIEIQKLTGGILLSRNKDYIVFYRGKDFLSPEVSEALVERERLAKTLQEEEERMRLQASSSVLPSVQPVEEYGRAGTLSETLEADAKWGNKIDEDHKDKIMRASEVARHEQLVRKLERKLSIADRRLMKAERALGEVEEFLKPAESNPDPGSITDEERFMFRKLGLRMKAFLLLGRRGVFGGTVENMHLHWKYRELVKIIIKAKTFSQVRDVALSLEAESGGVLVSVDKISKGFAIIVFRGKDYHRPSSLRPKNLLTKRKALARSIELQRRKALLEHTANLKQRVAQLKAELDLMENVEDQGNDDLYARLDEAYSTADEEDSEEEGEEAYLETLDGPVDGDGEDEDDDGYDDLIEMSDDETCSRAMGKEDHYV